MSYIKSQLFFFLIIKIFSAFNIYFKCDVIISEFDRLMRENWGNWENWGKSTYIL